MGKLDVSMMRYLKKEDFAILTAIEKGMKNHELVPTTVIAQIAKLRYGGLHKILKELCKYRLLQFEQTKQYEGYRLTNSGYDYLALKQLTSRDVIDSFGNQIGVGKESNIYVVSNGNKEQFCLKLHRLGRICFRQVKCKRNYHNNKKYMNWLYLSKVSATREFTYMKALYDRGFPVPKAIDFNRHCIIMELIDGTTLSNIREVEHPEKLYDVLMNIICKLAIHGAVHGDFNEFNIMITADEKPIIIDFPQMISTGHKDAEFYFERDVNCIRKFFRKRFAYESDLFPIFNDIVTENTDTKNKKSSKTLLHSPVVSDDEYELDEEEEEEEEEEDNDKSSVKSDDNKESDKDDNHSPEKNNDSEEESCLKDKMSNLNIQTEKEEQSILSRYLETNETDKNCEVPLTLGNDNASDKEFDTESCKVEKVKYHTMSVAPKTIPEADIKKRIKIELQKREKKIENKTNLKKSTITSKRRMENKRIAKENFSFSADDSF